MRNHKLTRMFGKKVRVGKFGLPVWALGLAAMGIAAVAGQAVGPVLAGSVSGSAGAVVSQTILLADVPTEFAGADTYDGVSVTSIAADDFAATVDDEGTGFTLAMETQVGQTTAVSLALKNGSGNSANFILEIKGPPGIDIAADEVAANADVAALARLGPNSWLGTLAASTDTDVDIHVVFEPKDDSAPGYYMIHGRIIQIR